MHYKKKANKKKTKNTETITKEIRKTMHEQNEKFHKETATIKQQKS